MKNQTEITITPYNTEFVWAVIYMWTNKVTGLSYIGQTCHEKDRISRHVQDSNNPNNKSYNQPFHVAIREYGIKNFEYRVLNSIFCPKVVARDWLNYWEVFFIAEYRTFENGYNRTKGGSGSLGHVVSEEAKRKISETNKTRTPVYGIPWNDNHKKAHYSPVIQYDLEGNKVNEFENMKEAAKSLGKTSTGNISNCCLGNRKIAYGFIWKYKNGR